MKARERLIGAARIARAFGDRTRREDVRQGTGRRAIAIDAAVVALAAGTLSYATGALAQAPAASAQDSCTKLSGTFIPASAIGLPSSGAVVQSASFVAADASNNPNGGGCTLSGRLRWRRVELSGL